MGEMVNAVYGFAASLLKAIKDEKPDYVVACFDASRETFRNDIYKAYKAHRQETDEALSLQIPRVKEIVEVLNIPLFAQKGVEADDLIGSLTKIAAKKGLHSVIVTGDNDALQLVNDGTSVYSLRRGVTDTLTYNRQDVKEKVGVFPEQIVDYKALAGDSSDNIPGAPGIGPKTAVDLLNKYHDLEGIYEHLTDLKERTAQILKDNKGQVMMSRELAAIKCDLKIDLDLEAADVSNFHFENVVSLFHELDFKSLLTKLPQAKMVTQGSLFDPKTAAEEPEDKITPQLPYEAVTDLKHWRELAEKLMKQPVLVIDTETVDFDGELIGIGFAWSKDEAAYLPLAPAYPEGLPIDKLRADLEKILGNEQIKKVGHNIKYDLHALTAAGIEVKNIWLDTMIASQLVRSQLYTHGIDNLAFAELGFRKINTTELLKLGGQKNAVMTAIPLEMLAAYCCEDALITWRLYEKFWPDLEELSVKKIFYEIEMPLLPILQKMEATGIKLDGDYLKKLGVKLKAELGKIEAKIHQLAGREFNIASPIQLQEVLFKDLKLPVTGLKKTKSGYSTDSDSLLKLKGQHPVVDMVTNYRELAKLLSTYIETLPAQIDKQGRVHTSFIQLGAATGRMASTNPNLQNIPIRTDLGNQVRRAFVADKGKVLLKADYSQAELRVLAHLSGDQNLIEAFHQQSDFHEAVGNQMGVDRRTAKAVNYGIIYGLGPNALAQDLSITVAEARVFIDKYFATFPGVKKFIDNMHRLAREQGYVSTLFGRRRYLPDIQSPNMMMRSAAERMAVNLPPQGTVADLMKLSMIKVDPELPTGAAMLLQIHDELLFEIDKSQEKKVAEIVKEAMSSVAELKVPMIVDVKTGPNWADLELV